MGSRIDSAAVAKILAPLHALVAEAGKKWVYIITVVVIAIACLFFRGYAFTINKMTVIALVTLVIAWITSMAVFEKESKVKSKVIAFSCVMAAVSYLVSQFVSFTIL